MKTLLALILLALPALAGTVTVAWDANPPDENVTSYRIHYGTESRHYTEMVDVGNVTTLDLFLPAGVYFLNVTALNASGESAMTQEVSFTVPGTPPSPVENLRIIEVQTSSDLKEWRPVAWVPAGEPPFFLRAVTKTIPEP